MYYFSWRGINSKKMPVSGITRSTCIAMLKMELHKQKIHCTQIRKKPDNFFAKKISKAQLSLFFNQISRLLTAGVPLMLAMDSMIKNRASLAMQCLLSQLKKDMEQGFTFAESLAKQAPLFSPFICQVVEIGEKSGKLDFILGTISRYLERTAALKKKIKKALAYPSMILLISAFVTFFLLIFVVPQFQELYTSFNSELPFMTKILVTVANFFIHYLVFLLIPILIFTAVIFQKRAHCMSFFLANITKIPVLSSLYIKSFVAKFALILGTTCKAGLPLGVALHTLQGNGFLSSVSTKIEQGISAGRTIQEAFQSTLIFPDMAIQMIAIGEETGNLGPMLDKIADFYEEDFYNSIEKFASILEPSLMALIGVLIGGFVLALYLPIFKLGALF